MSQLHGGMCKSLCSVYVKLLAIFPELEAARPRSTSGIQALCALHIALEKTKNILQHCSECSKLYLVRTAPSLLLFSFFLRDMLDTFIKIFPHLNILSLKFSNYHLVFSNGDYSLIDLTPFAHILVLIEHLHISSTLTISNNVLMSLF